MAQQKTTTAVAKANEAALAAASAYAESGYDGKGFENVTQEHITMPFIALLQALSPQVAKAPGQGGIEGARPGMFLNTVTGELADGKAGVEFVPSKVEHLYVEWVPREKGGGFVAIHQPESEVVRRAKEGSQKFGKYSTSYDANGAKTGNDLIETFYIYGVAKDARGEWLPAIIAATSTKIRPYKQWMTKVLSFQIRVGERKVKPPLFAHRVIFQSEDATNKSNQSYSVIRISPAEGDVLSSLLAPNDERFQAAVSVLEFVNSGLAKIDHEKQNAAGGPEADAGGGTERPGDEPF